MSIETWRPIPGYEGAYEVSDRGRVRSLDRPSLQGYPLKGRMLATSTQSHHRYARVTLIAPDGTQKRVMVHGLVMLAFVGPRPDGYVVCHFDDNQRNNRLENLRYDTQKANVADQVRNGKHARAAQTECKHGHPLTDGDNVRIRVRVEGWTVRECLTCRKWQDARRYLRRKAARKAARELKAAS